MSGELRAFLDGTPVGSFLMTDGGNVTFAYDDAYRANRNATPLSLSMMPERSVWKSRAATPFLAGLLPDSMDRLDNLAAEFHTTSHPFKLLEHVGRDAAGAVQLLPPGEASTDAASRSGDVARLSRDEFASLLATVARDPGSWGGPANGGRWSLAGAQAKAALFRFEDGSWGLPRDSTPTTHILKPVVAALPDHAVNEYVSMDAARRLGLNVAGHEVIRTDGGLPVFVSPRYDRSRDETGHWRRLHQEDLCQALSVHPSRKYQQDGGPSVKQIAGLLRSIRDVADRRAAQTGFFDALVFNVAALGTDAHAKNYSLMLDQRRVTLAPLYDLGSHAAYPTSDGSPLRAAMTICDENRFDAIGERQFRDIASSLGLSKDEATDRYRHVTAGISAAFADSARALDGVPTDGDFAVRLADAVAAHARARGWEPRRTTITGTGRRSPLEPAGGHAGEQPRDKRGRYSEYIAPVAGGSLTIPPENENED